MANGHRRLIIDILSAIFATLLLVGAALLLLNKLSIWTQIGSAEHFRSLFALVYAILLTISGWFFVKAKSLIAGCIHSALMFGIAGIVAYGIASGLTTSPGSDNAAAGIVIAANLLFILVGVFAAFCGFGIALCIFRKS